MPISTYVKRRFCVEQISVVPLGGMLRSGSMQRSEYIVLGMTCAHCVASVREEVGEVPGVRGIELDLESGRLAVTGDGVEDAAVRAAVTEAGYEVAE